MPVTLDFSPGAGSQAGGLSTSAVRAAMQIAVQAAQRALSAAVVVGIASASGMRASMCYSRRQCYWMHGDQEGDRKVGGMAQRQRRITADRELRAASASFAQRHTLCAEERFVSDVPTRESASGCCDGESGTGTGGSGGRWRLDRELPVENLLVCLGERERVEEPPPAPRSVS